MDDQMIAVQQQNGALVFSPEEEPGQKTNSQNKWNILIVDDDQEVHMVTKMVLSGQTFAGRGFNFESCYSGQQAKDALLRRPDTAIILLDVVMETDDAGLQFVKWVREELKNKFVRIILRTGQPGQAPEEKVIVEYDINDYKEKTELTSRKLLTTIISTLRSYRDVTTIEANRRGLQKIIEASANIFQLQSMKKFACGVLTQLTALVNVNRNAFYCRTSGFAATKHHPTSNDYFILAATGDYCRSIDQKARSVLPEQIMQLIERATITKKSIFNDESYIGYFCSQKGYENIIFLEGVKNLSAWEQDMIEIFCCNVAIAFENLYLNKEIEDTQKEVIYMLGDFVELRSLETGKHIKRVAKYTKLLALKAGLPDEMAKMLELAVPLHDIGKLSTPDYILNKPAQLTDQEYAIMKQHTIAGYNILKQSQRVIIKMAALIALQHHEKYDGSGYPYGLSGQDIDICGRIAAIADVFDALDSDRVYRPAWPMTDIFEYFRSQRGLHFDPVLTDLLLNNIDEFLTIRHEFSSHHID